MALFTAKSDMQGMGLAVAAGRGDGQQAVLLLDGKEESGDGFPLSGEKGVAASANHSRRTPPV